MRNRRSRFARLLACLICALSLLPATPAFADFEVGKDQAGWDRTAAIARQWLTRDEAGQHALPPGQWEDLRLTLTVERELAQQKAQQRSLDIRIVQAQLGALGPAPTAGTHEPPWVAGRRDQFNALLAQAEQPRLAAAQAAARATVLIIDIDKVTQHQSRARLLGRTESVLEPAFWRAFSEDLGRLPAKVAVGALNEGNNAAYLGASIAAGLLAVLAAFFAHRWIFGLERKVTPSPRSHLGFAFLKDLTDIALPMLVILIVLALLDGAAKQLAMPSGLDEAIIYAGAIAIYLHWLGRSLLRPFFEPGRVIALPQDQAARAIAISTALGVILAAESLIEFAEGIRATPPTWLTLASLAVIIGASACLWSLTRMIRATPPDHAPASLRETKSALDLKKPLLRLLMVAALAAPLLAVSGYVSLARDFLTSAIYTVAAIGTALFLFRSVTQACDILFDRFSIRKSASWQFVPLVLGFFLVLFTLPIVLMIWGVGAASIMDGILAIKDGIQIGQVRVSFGNVLAFGVVFMLGYLLTRWAQRLVQIALFPRIRLDAGGKAALLTAVGYGGLTLSALVATTAAGLDLRSVAVVAGALSVGVGFGLQSIVSNFVSGLILLVERPVKEGDWIEVGGVSGHVRRIAFRSTHIETSDRQEVIIPNSDLISGSVTNLTYGNSEGRISLPVGVAYGSDMDKAKQALLDVARDHPKVIAAPEPLVTMDGFGESAVNLTLLCFVEDVNERRLVRSDLYFAMLEALGKAGIDIPFPQRDVRIRQS